MARPRTTIGISDNGRYFVDKSGSPLFWLGDTQWNLFRCHTLEEAKFILDNRREKGFSFIQIMLLGCTHGVTAGPVHGEAFPEKNSLQANPDYFAHVDAVIEYAAKCDLILVIGLDHPSINLATMETAKHYGHWIGKRYKNHQNIIWLPSYTIPDTEHLPIMREIAAGLQEGDDGIHLITSHPDPAHPTISSSVAHNEAWLAFNCIQTFKSTELIYDTVTHDYCLRPTKPVVMAEGAYEEGPEYGFDVTPLWVRRQAYWTYLTGGHHSYGHNDNWRVNPTWKTSLDAPGAQQMAVLNSIFTTRKWWSLMPDQSIFISGAGQSNDLNIAARANSGEWLMAYLSHHGSVAISMDKITAAKTVTARWVDPRDGSVVDIETLPTSGTKAFSMPDGWEDALLILE